MYTTNSSGTTAEIDGAWWAVTTAGSPLISSCNILKIAGSSPPYSISVPSTCTSTSPCYTQFDDLSLTIDVNHDYYLMVQFKDDSNNSTLKLAVGPSSTMSSGSGALGDASWLAWVDSYAHGACTSGNNEPGFPANSSFTPWFLTSFTF